VEFIFIADSYPATVVAVEMWEPALYAGFQAPGTRLRNSRSGNAAGLPARHFQSEVEDSTHFHPKQPQTTAQDRKQALSESRVDRAFLQILVQSPKEFGIDRSNLTRENEAVQEKTLLSSEEPTAVTIRRGTTSRRHRFPVK
jgi:hypothetical protein